MWKDTLLKPALMMTVDLLASLFPREHRLDNFLFLSILPHFY